MHSVAALTVKRFPEDHEMWVRATKEKRLQSELFKLNLKELKTVCFVKVVVHYVKLSQWAILHAVVCNMFVEM